MFELALLYGFYFFLVVIALFLTSFFCWRTIVNFRRNEKYSVLRLFTHPKVGKAFRIVSVLSFIFGVISAERAIVGYIIYLQIGEVVTARGGFLDMIVSLPFYITALGILLGMSYLSKVLSYVTTEREAKLSIKEGKVIIK